MAEHQEPTGRRVLVTGAARGLGAALVGRLRDHGDRVLATDIADPPEDPGTYLRLDVTSDSDWSSAREWVLDRWGGLDLLIANAGVAGGGRLDVATLDEWRWLTEINLFGVVRGIREFTPVFKRQRSGHIVTIASLAGLVHPAGMASYNAVKAGVVALTETVGHELAAYGVTATVVCPSYFRSSLNESIRGCDTAVADTVGRLITTSPSTADEIAEEVVARLDDGEALILPDDAGRSAYALKLADRPTYDAVMRQQAVKLDGRATREGDHR